MRYRIFGRRTGLRVSELALETGNFGTRWGHGAERDEAKKVFDAYVEAGGNFMSKMRVMQVTHPGGPFELVEREIPEPGAGSARIKVEACGVCHSDSITKEDTWPGIQYQRVPGHEVAESTPGQRVGVAWVRRALWARLSNASVLNSVY